MNRITKLFQNKDKQILSIYFTAGFPKLGETKNILHALQNSGVDLVEIGFPFSDPLADGPVIQKSSSRAIRNGMNLEFLFKELKNIREEIHIPIILMGYLNPVLQFGEERFLDHCKEVGIDGLILPDLPPSLYNKFYRDKFEQRDIKNILLITPETSTDRIYEIDKLSNGFIYMVSSNSITGGNHPIEKQVSYFERIQSLSLNNPTLIGFGIRNRENFNVASRYSKGAIIGSSFIQLLEKYGVDEKQVQEFISNLK